MRSGIPLSPEAQLVLRSHGAREPDSVVKQILEGPVDWRRVLALADRERAALPVWRTVHAAGLEPDRPELWALSRLADVWEFKLAYLERRVAETMHALGTKGIEAVPLKGAAAAASVHGSFELRPMNDVDLLVQADRAEEAWELAREIGWSWDSEELPLASYTEAHHLPPLLDSRGSQAGLEIHRSLWMPDHPFAFDEEDLRRDAVSGKVAGVACRAPSVHHQLLHACIHFAWSHRLRSHAWRAFVDVRALVASGEIDWGRFVGLVRESNAETCVYWTLRLCRSSVGLALPDGVVEAVAPSGPAWVLDRLERHFLMNLMPDDGGCPSLAMERALWRRALGRGPGSAGISLPADEEQVGLAARLVRHVREVGAWARYIVRLT